MRTLILTAAVFSSSCCSLTLDEPKPDYTGDGFTIRWHGGDHERARNDQRYWFSEIASAHQDHRNAQEISGETEMPPIDVSFRVDECLDGDVCPYSGLYEGYETPGLISLWVRYRDDRDSFAHVHGVVCHEMTHMWAHLAAGVGQDEWILEQRANRYEDAAEHHFASDRAPAVMTLCTRDGDRL